MSRLVFKAENRQPQLLGNYLRTKCGISNGLLRKLKHTDGGILVNGNPAKVYENVVCGDEIVLTENEVCDLTANAALEAEAVYETDDLVVFDKPAGMPVHPSIRHRDDTLGNLFAARYPENVYRPVNRLDKDTSGLCIVAKNTRSAALLQGSGEKVYYAAVHGITDEAGTIDAPIAREQESIITRCVREDGKRAVTHYRRIAVSEKYSLLEIHLETGRTHQIRVHFSYTGHPLAGDDMYGGSPEDISRQALHCGKITFESPSGEGMIEVNSDIPQDIKNLFINGKRNENEKNSKL